MYTNKIGIFLILILLPAIGITQPSDGDNSVDLRIANKDKLYSGPIEYGMAYLLRENSTVVDSIILDNKGQGEFKNVLAGVGKNVELPVSFHVSQNYPNPINTSTHLEISNERFSKLTCGIYSIDGKLVKSFKFDAYPGHFIIEWYGEDNRGKPLSKGIYFAKVSDGKINKTLKMVLLGSNPGISRIYSYAISTTFGQATTKMKANCTNAEVGRNSGNLFMIYFTNSELTWPPIVPWTTGLFEVNMSTDTTFFSETICSPISDHPLFPSPYGSPVWHPNGRIGFNWTKILKVNRCYGFVNEQDIDHDSTGFWIINPDGTGLQRLLPYGLSSPAWSADGQWIAFGAGQIYKMKFTGTQFDTTTLTQLTTEGSCFFPAWSPDGQWIAYDRSVDDESGPAGIWIMKFDGTQKKAVFDAVIPFWHPSGNVLLGVMTGRFIQYDFIHSNVINSILVDGVSANSYPKYSPDGAKIAFLSQTSSGPIPQLCIMNTDGSNRQQLTTYGVDDIFSCSPDGNELVYSQSDWRKADPNNGTLWIMNADGSNKRQLTFNYGLSFYFH